MLEQEERSHVLLAVFSENGATQGRGPQRGEDWREAMLAGEGEPHLSSTASIGHCGAGAKELLSPADSGLRACQLHLRRAWACKGSLRNWSPCCPGSPQALWVGGSFRAVQRLWTGHPGALDPVCHYPRQYPLWEDI